ncbi:hypothetical protein [Roseibium sp.]|uniref:hypothetical protein n=1 Tax=Roseibium sp. TaxID=1936156 RepID=UPI003B500683
MGRLPIAQCVFALAILGVLVATGAVAGSYELLFRQGTLDAIPEHATLEYQRTVSAPASQSLEVLNTGPIRLQQTGEGMAEIHFGLPDQRRRVGAFPASVGNPMIMYFLETVVRDLSGLAGGSPFYMRNRIKAELSKKHRVQDMTLRLGDRDVEVHTIVLYPFRDDPASDRMRGIETLALSITFSDDVPGWYYSLRAETTTERGKRSALPDTLPAYTSTILFKGLEAGK